MNIETVSVFRHFVEDTGERGPVVHVIAQNEPLNNAAEEPPLSLAAGWPFRLALPSLEQNLPDQGQPEFGLPKSSGVFSAQSRAQGSRLLSRKT